MTTLPQTTSVRLPRPSGPAALTVPGPLAAPPAGGGMTGSDVWRVLRANMWLIIITLVVSGILGYGAYWYLGKYHSRFTAEGYVQIQPIRLRNLMEGEAAQLDTKTLNIEARTQAQWLKSDALINSVLTDPNNPIRETDWFKSFLTSEVQSDGSVVSLPRIAAAKLDLERNFSVVPYPDSKLIRVTMTAASPTDARTIVMSIVSEHLAGQQRLNREKQQQLGQDLTVMKSKHQASLNRLSEDMRQRLAELSLRGVTPGAHSSPKDVELSQLIKDQYEANKEFQQLKSQYETFMSQVEQGIDPPSVEEAVSRDPRIFDLQRQVDLLESRIASNLHLGSDHRRVKEVQHELDVARQRLTDATAEKKSQIRLAHQQSFAMAVADADRNLKTVNERVDQMKADLGQLSYNTMEYLTRKDEAEYYQEQLKQVDQRLLEIAQVVQQSSLATVDWAMRPVTPQMRSFPKLPVVMAAALMLGLALSLGIAFIRELLDTSVRSPRDIQKVGQMNLLGMIPHEHDDPQAAAVPLPTIIVQAPTSMLAEQFRQVRTRLQQATSLDTTRSILVTSPGPGDGKTTVAANLAAGLALNGRRILLVDGNFRRPEIHKIFGVANDAGFTDVLADISRFDSCVHQTTVPNLDVIPSGPKASNPTELMESQLLIDFIERALEEYDHVIFDSGPMLVVSETVALAPRVDGVVSVVRARTNSRGLLQRMRDQLRQLKAEHLGVVLNGVRAQGGGYYGRNIKTYYEYQNGHAH